MTFVRVLGVSAGYSPDSPIIRDVTMHVPMGQMMAVLGPSGCGKTTLLRTIAGLLPVAEGTIQFDGIDVNTVPAEKRGTAMVFQKPLLFPHLNVSENVAFGLRMRGIRAEERARLVAEALSRVHLAGFGPRRVNQLSGGQEQRVALARALVVSPRVLLLDEPLSSLDVSLRAEMREMIRSLQRALGITSVFVTHDQQEAAELAHEIVVMIAGHVVQTGSARVLYTRPATPAVARLFGWQRWNGDVWCRPESVETGFPSEGWIPMQGRVLDVRDVGTHLVASVEVGISHLVRAHITAVPGETVHLRVHAADTVEF